jgi:HD-GYP domain-containing protein (c-di-GMP phosphodiesterase class II)
MREHPRYTEDILRGVAAFAPFAAISAAHHERMDGGGYHRGVRAGDLPASARALAVADVFEALTADRPYRGPMPPEQALGIMRESAGTQLCPICLEALEDGLETAVAQAA